MFYKKIIIFLSVSFLILISINFDNAKAEILPDLSVADITVSPAEPDAFEKVTITVRVKNNGSELIDSQTGLDSFSRSFDNFNIDSEIYTYPSQQNILYPGGYMSYIFIGSFDDLQSQSLKFTIDASDRLLESDEKNNDLTKKITVNGYDFEAIGMDVIPKKPAQNQSCKIVVSIINNGTYNIYSSSGFNDYKYNFNNFVATKVETSFPSLSNVMEPDDEIEYIFTGKFTEQGETNAAFEFDINDIFEEANENNNNISKKITVVDPNEIDLEVDSVSVSSSYPTVNTDYTIEAKIKNVGDVSLTDKVGLRDYDLKYNLDKFTETSRTQDEYPTIDDPLEPGEIFTFSFSGRFYGIGPQILSFMIDKDNALKDVDFSNNTKSESTAVYLNTDSKNNFYIMDHDVVSVSTSSMKITWLTDKETNGKVKYKENTPAAPYVEASSSGTNTNHAVTLSGLKNNTSYLYQIIATKGEIIKDTPQETFVTPLSSEIKFTETPKVYANYTEAKISAVWSTNLAANGHMYYKKSGENEYKSVSEDTSTTYHVIEATNLTSGEYELYVVSEGSAGTKIESQKYYITIKELESEEEAEIVVVEDEPSNTENNEKISITNNSLYNNIKGKIVLKVEQNGEAYYVDPKSKNMYFLGRPADAFGIMRGQGVGITNENLKKIPVGLGNVSGEDSDGDGLTDLIEDALGTDKNKKDTDGDTFSDKEEVGNNYNPLGNGKINIDSNFSASQKGMIFLQVENHGEAWYINPADGKRYFLGRPADAFNVMRFLGLGISNSNFDSL